MKVFVYFFFFNDTATTEIYTLSLHDALPISIMKIFIDTANVDEIKKIATWGILDGVTTNPSLIAKEGRKLEDVIDRKSTRLNSSHANISYAVFCLKKKKQ